MPNYLPFPIGETILLSAGPRAGKTDLLAHWRSVGLAPTVYLALTPEDAEAEFFRYRLLQSWPRIQARYEALATRLPSSWGALLGIAIAETKPNFCLLLDDLQAVEETALLPELLALIRHFPATGHLAIASRHQIPPITGRTCTLIGPNHPYWQERPDPEDLLGLPPSLLSMALVTQLLGEAPPSQDGRELVRRNIAKLDDSSKLQLRTPWQAVAERALAFTSLDGLWERLEAPIKAFHQMHFNTPQEQRLHGVIAMLPRAVREQHPYFLQLQGDMRLGIGQAEEARIYYQQALNQAHDQPERQPDLLLCLANSSLRIPALPECRSLIERFEQLGHEPTALQRARFGNLKGRLHLQAGELDAAKATCQEVTGIPTAGDRYLAYERYLALNVLANIHTDLGETDQADRDLHQAIVLATEHRFQRSLLSAYMTRLTCEQGPNPASVLPIRQISEIPNECFVFPTPSSTHNLLYTMGIRADYLGEAALAVRYFSWAKLFAKAHCLTLDHSNLGLLNTYRSLQRFDEAKQIYAELRHSSSFEAHRYFIQAAWALTLVESKHFREAEALLEEELAYPYPEAVRTRVLLHVHYVRHRRGDDGALGVILTMLDSDWGSMLWHHGARLLQRLGLRSLPPVFRIRAFGPLSFCRDDLTPLHWPRKKPLSFLGHLVLHPEGITSEHLAEELFGDPEDLESVHTVAYRLRQGLKEAEASDLPEANSGTYRLRWERIAFCDLHEFDALYDKARSLEAEAIFAGAALFYGLALRVAQGPLFDNLPREFEEAREHYGQRVRYAHDFLQAHRFPGISAP